MDAQGHTPAAPIEIPDDSPNPGEQPLDPKEALFTMGNCPIKHLFKTLIHKDGAKSSTHIVCNLKLKDGSWCRKTLQAKPTSSPLRHIRKKHPEHLPPESSLVENESKKDNSQPKIPELFGATPSQYTAKTHKDLVLQLIVSRDLPFSAAEWPEFKQLQTYLRPNCEIFGTTAIRTRFDDVVEQFRQGLKEALAEVDSKIGLTTDGWSNDRMQPYSTLTAHWIDAEWNVRSVMLSFDWIEGSHDGKNLFAILLKQLIQFGIVDKIIGVTTDNGGGNSTLMKELAAYLTSKGIPFSVSWQWQRY
jgi:hypothetical protein